MAVTRSTGTVFSFTLALLLANAAHVSAATYRCTDSGGNVTYSQKPCLSSDDGDQPQQSMGRSADNNTLCSIVGDVATDLFKKMRKGNDGYQLIQKMGGVDSVSAPMLGIINYLSSLKHNKALPPARVGSLSAAKCRGGGFGRVSLNDLPEAYVQARYPYSPGVQPWLYPDQPMEQMAPQQAPSQPVDSSAALPQTVSNQAQCDEYKTQLENIDDRMRRQYSTYEGEMLREQQRYYKAYIHANCK